MMMLIAVVPVWGWFALGTFFGAAITLVWVGVSFPDPPDPIVMKVRADAVQDDAHWGSPLDGIDDDEIRIVGEWADPETFT